MRAEIMTSRDFCEDKRNFSSWPGMHISSVNNKDAVTGIYQDIQISILF